MQTNKVFKNEMEGSVSSRCSVYKLLEAEFGSQAKDIETVEIATKHQPTAALETLNDRQGGRKVLASA